MTGSSSGRGFCTQNLWLRSKTACCLTGTSQTYQVSTGISDGCHYFSEPYRCDEPRQSCDHELMEPDTVCLLAAPDDKSEVMMSAPWKVHLMEGIRAHLSLSSVELAEVAPRLTDLDLVIDESHFDSGPHEHCSALARFPRLDFLAWLYYPYGRDPDPTTDARDPSVICRLPSSASGLSRAQTSAGNTRAQLSSRGTEVASGGFTKGLTSPRSLYFVPSRRRIMLSHPSQPTSICQCEGTAAYIRSTPEVIGTQCAENLYFHTVRLKKVLLTSFTAFVE